MGILGIYGNDVCFFAASKYAPVAQVIIINFLWPIFVLVFSQILLNEKFKVKHILSICLGLGAICLALMEKFGYIHFEYTKGYILAFGSATSWTIFMLFSRSYRHVTSEFVGMCLGVGCILSIIFHLNFERFVLPNFRELFSICLIGLFIKGSAYYLWDMGIKRGNFQLLIVLAYVQPILSIIWLMLFGYTKISLSIFMASFLIFTACFILTKK
ncbi:MAG: DMT family transporter [Legionellales bacterium]|nr:DMT family transporter [Legionellales bacterium]